MRKIRYSYTIVIDAVVTDINDPQGLSLLENLAHLVDECMIIFVLAELVIGDV